MNCVYVRNLRLGEGTPKVCIPLVGASDEALFEEIKALSSYLADLVEWRTDYMNDIFNEGRLTGLLPRLRKHLGNTPLIFTFRTTKEGGQRQASPQQYKTLAMEAIASGCIDLIDIELFSDPDSITELTALAKEKGVKTIFSSHDFYSTPSCGELLSRLRHMEKLGADIAKIAVMPRCPEDVLTLLTATVTARRQLTCPVVTMAMAGTGLISRVWGEIFGSCLTFGLAGQASAPGQIDARELKCVLDILHNNL